MLVAENDNLIGIFMVFVSKAYRRSHEMLEKAYSNIEAIFLSFIVGNHFNLKTLSQLDKKCITKVRSTEKETFKLSGI